MKNLLFPVIFKFWIAWMNLVRKETQLGKAGLDLGEMSWKRPRKIKWQDDLWIEAPYPDENDGDTGQDKINGTTIV